MIIATLKFQNAELTLKDIQRFKEVDKSEYGNNNLELGVRKVLCDIISNMLDFRTHRIETLINITQIANRYFRSEDEVLEEIDKDIIELKELGYIVVYFPLEISKDDKLIIFSMDCKEE